MFGKLKFDIEGGIPPTKDDIKAEIKRLNAIAWVFAAAAAAGIIAIADDIAGAGTADIAAAVIIAAAAAVVAYAAGAFAAIRAVGVVAVAAAIAGDFDVAGSVAVALAALEAICEKRMLRELGVDDSENIQQLEKARRANDKFVRAYLTAIKEANRLPVLTEIAALENWINGSENRKEKAKNKAFLDSLRPGAD